MIRDFTKDELEAVERDSDTELTLGGGTLIALGCGLLSALRGLFGIGYLVGHRSSSESAIAMLPPSKSKASVTQTGSGSKPGAAGQAQTHAQTQEAVGVSGNSAADLTPSAHPQSAVAGTSTGSPKSPIKTAIDAQVRPALADQSAGVQSASPFRCSRR